MQWQLQRGAAVAAVLRSSGQPSGRLLPVRLHATGSLAHWARGVAAAKAWPAILTQYSPAVGCEMKQVTYSILYFFNVLAVTRYMLYCTTYMHIYDAHCIENGSVLLK